VLECRTEEKRHLRSSASSLHPPFHFLKAGEGGGGGGNGGGLKQHLVGG
jgi:hypothetical protein